MHIDGFEEAYTKWEQKRKQAKNPSAAQQKNGKKEQFVKEQLALERRMDAIIDWDRGARLEKKTDDIKSDTGAIRAKQEEDSKLIRGLADQLETDRETMKKFDRVNSGAALPDRPPDQTASGRLAVVYGEIRRLQSEGKNLRPEVAAELRAQRPAAAKGRGRGRGSASKPTAGSIDVLKQATLDDMWVVPVSDNKARATDVSTDGDGGGPPSTLPSTFKLILENDGGGCCQVECECDDTILDVKCRLAPFTDGEFTAIVMECPPFTISNEELACTYTDQKIQVRGVTINCGTSGTGGGGGSSSGLSDVFSLVVARRGLEAITLDVVASDTIANVKAKIQEADGTPPDQQRLKSGRNELQDHETLNDYNIQKSKKLQLCKEKKKKKKKMSTEIDFD